MTSTSELSATRSNLFPFPASTSTKRAAYIDAHFPVVRHGCKPNGANVFVQLRMVPKKSGMIELPQQTRDFNEQQTCLGLVLAIGPSAFKDRDSGQPWHEGPWYAVGDLVMVKRHQGRRFATPVPGTDGERVVIAVINEYDVDSTVDADFEDLDSIYDQII